MAKEYRQNASYNDIIGGDNGETPEAEGNEGADTPQESKGSGNTRLPFGLCKRYGIALPEGATPRDAWNALKGKGITPEKVYKELDKKEEKEEKPKAEDQKQGEKATTEEELITKAKEKNIYLDSLFGHLPENIALEQGNKVLELYEQFPIKTKTGAPFDICTDRLGGGTVAQAKYSTNIDHVSISLDIGSFVNEDYVKTTEEMVKVGWWADTAQESMKYQSIAHEYGHAIEYSLLSLSGFGEALEQKLNELKEAAYYDWRKRASIQKEYKKAGKALRKQMFVDRVFPEIFKRAKQIDSSITIPKNITAKGYETAPNVSRYGATSWAEYFAESFANGMCGKPNAIGQATVEVIKDIYKGKIKW